MFKALIVALAAVAAAIPTSPQPSGSNGNQCGNGKLECCNKEAFGQILPVDALNFYCPQLDIIEILKGNCHQQAACCSNVEQTGVVNIACTPIDL